MWFRYEHSEVLENGDKVKVRIGFNDRSNSFVIDDVVHVPKGKRKEIFLKGTLTDIYSFRVLNMENRRKAEMKLFIDTVGIDVMNRALAAAWESTRPEALNPDDYHIEY